MSKKILIFIVIILVILIRITVVEATANNVKEKEIFSLTLVSNDNQIYINKNENVKKIYNTLMLSMNNIFTQLYDGYQEDSEEQRLNCNGTTLEINRKEKIITVPNVYNIEAGQINDSVNIEIEEINGIEYIPIYLIANMPGIEVTIDNKKVYDEDGYLNCIEALDNRNDQHNIMITLKNTEEKNISNTEYVDEEKGALWKEEAYKRIEKYRKSNLDIILKNQNGRLLNNATVNIKMTNNEFKFGTSIRMVEATRTNKFIGIERRLFNTLGSENGFKWSVLANDGSEIPKDVISYSIKNGMDIRGHALWTDCLWADTENLIGNIEYPEENTMAYIYSNYNNENITYEEAKELINNMKNIFENMIFKHIEEEMVEFPEVKEWDVINELVSQQYFKYYLYDEKMLTDNTFLTTKGKNRTTYSDSEEYYQFLAKCFDKARKSNQNAKLVINEDKVDGNYSSSVIPYTIKAIKGIQKYTNNIDALGIQYHANNRYYFTPQSYYNQINYVLEQTGIKEAIITEYDNYTSDKLNKYTKEERKEKANYLRDTLIAQYSNKNVSGFNFWVYNSGTGSFVEEEWQVYEELMKEWLNDEQNGMTDNNGEYSTRAYKGEYTAKVKINELETEVPIKVNDNLEPIEIIINSNLQKISVKQKPIKTEYIQDEEYFNADGGVILAHYDDGTVEEINMNSSDVKISYLDNSILGKQTMTVTYEDKKVTFVVDVIERDLEDVKIKNKIVHKNDNISGIKVDQLPEKIEYIQNEEDIKLEGGKILVTYDDETTKEISMNNKNVSISGFDNSILGEKAIRASYEGKETTFVVDVIEDKSKSDTTMATTILPKAGVKIATLTVIFIVAVVGTIYGKKYIQYLKDTHKQLK